MLYLTFILIEVLLVNGYPQFMERIPNGKNVSDPCIKDKIWSGVGHLIAEGSGARNQFGLDFAANGMVWDKTLCTKDSDGDGRSNGEELGDPECTWKINETAMITTNISHPGICEPLSSHKCMEKNSWLKCPEIFSCPAFDLPDTKSTNLTIPRTAIPQNETSYFCIGFKLPNDTKYHLIGQKSVIENKNMLHHMILYGCNAPLNGSILIKPESCLMRMGMANCTTLLGLWVPGTTGECQPKEFGFPMGHFGFQYAMLQLHWNNPLQQAGEFDSSGMTIYYTSQLRPNDGIVFLAGQVNITIPPYQEKVTVEGSCKKECSKLIKPTSVNISAATLHMHLLGKSGKVELIKEGKQPMILVDQRAYDFNTPTQTNFDTPIEFNAGDEIKVTCEYQSLNKSTVTRFGEGTHDEMCYSFLTIFPAVRNFDTCTQDQELALCSNNQNNIYNGSGCDLDTFSILLDPISKICNSNCSEACLLLIQALSTTNCWGDQFLDYFQKTWPQFDNANFAKVSDKINKCSQINIEPATQQVSQKPLQNSTESGVSTLKLHSQMNTEASKSSRDVSASKADVLYITCPQQQQHMLSGSSNPAVRLSLFLLIQVYSVACIIILL